MLLFDPRGALVSGDLGVEFFHADPELGDEFGIVFGEVVLLS